MTDAQPTEQPAPTKAEPVFSGRMVNLQPADSDEAIPTPVEIAQQSITIKNMMEDLNLGPDQSDVAIPLHNVKKDILEKVLDYCKRHYENPEEKTDDKKKDLEISPADKEFTDSLPKTARPHEKLFELMLAANYLDIKPLLDLTCKTVAYLVVGKNPEEIRKEFGIEKPFTPEDYEKLRQDFDWAKDETKEKQ
eukprot:TRINITY_DN1078_c0_g1_i1.p1 TRINITY_DN1078_c0_g1~~TRINITY_DN1078_c0_g1_i1.p1  ORF type:complete len:193 (-),score=29.99 TRINITY_DN1078_c0_g1_i1:53-631(-)